MEIKGRVTQLLPLQTGEGKNGTWRKQDFIIETDGQYPKKICIAAWGDKIDISLLQVGNEINVSFDVESREYNTRWYTDVKAWKIEASSAVAASAPNSGGSAFDDFIPKPSDLPADGDNLPF